MVRPKKSEDDKRSFQMNLRFSLEEIVALEERAKSCGVSVTAYARRVILGVPISFQEKADPALVVALNKIGVNLNQMTHAFNREAIIPSSALEKTLEQVNKTLDRLMLCNEVVCEPQ